jgi:Uma2 family endonuclease
MPAVIRSDETRNAIPFACLKRFTAAQYNHLAEVGAFVPEDRMELLDGYLVSKETLTPLAATALGLLEDEIRQRLPRHWIMRCQAPVALSGDNVPEPDLAVVRGPIRGYFHHHPFPTEITLAIEVAETSLDQDRGIKQELYSRDRIPEYWIVNLVDRTVEVYMQPRAGRTPGYRKMVSYAAGSSVPLRIEGKEIGSVAVNNLLP